MSPHVWLVVAPATLRSLAQGRATHTRAFHAYEEVPAHEVPKLVEATKKEREVLLAAR
jgi:translation elongation factor EF-G